ncbi:MAG TPA: DNA polymerase III subunit gamma/tau, partial [Bacteroidales bacterium]|nr:DNA polymerase III subunit gamma/tau [Bacteroidales bacterium]
MENFVVSARKYRPTTFDMVVGQTSITTTLKNAIRNDQLAQSFLFCGPRGVGKTTCARILAKTINCNNLTSNIEPCNECEPCRSFNVSASFNIHELDAASNNKVEDIRALVEQVRIPPQGVRYKVYIIDEVHMLSQAAFNAFLKTLEEPPPYAKFILATTEKHKILPTIISRCQVFDFKRITIDDIACQLAYVAKNESIEAEIDALHIIAQKADGSMRDALSIFDQIASFSGNKITYQAVIENLNILDFDYYFKLTDFLLDSNVPSSLILFNEIIENGFDGQYFLGGLAEHFRNLLVAQDNSTIKLLEVGESLKSRYLEQSLRCNYLFILKALDLLSLADFNYKESNNKKLLVELTLAKICGLMESANIATQNNKINLPISQAPVSDVSLNKDKGYEKKIKVSSKKEEEQQVVLTKSKNITKSDNKNKYEIIKTVSIQEELKKGLNTINTKNINEKELPSNTFTQEDLEKAWELYREPIREYDANMYI